MRHRGVSPRPSILMPRTDDQPPLPLNAVIDFGAAAHQGDLERMRSMIDEKRVDINGVPPAWKSIYQPTPLAYAVWGNQPEAVKLLLESGADPDHVDGVRCVHFPSAVLRALTRLLSADRTTTTTRCIGRRIRATTPSAHSS